jgi:predicted nucleic acid-binding Zn finger protein
MVLVMLRDDEILGNLVDLVYVYAGDAQRFCGKSGVTFSVRTTGNVVGGQPEYVVAIGTSCSCPMMYVRVWCDGLEDSAVPLDASKVEVQDGMCVLKQPVAKDSPVVFKYSSKVPVNFRVFNASPRC